MIRNEVLENKPLLTFAVPTWNRGKYIKSTLDSIINEIIKQENKVEIFVSNNASTDNTVEILKEYSNKYDFFKFKTNEQNLGFDLNLLNAIENSNSIYVWTISDDDLLHEGALKKILDLIKEFNPNYIITDYTEFITKNGIMKELYSNREIKVNNKSVANYDTSLDFKQLLSIGLDDCGFFSVNVFKKEALKIEEIRLNYKKVKAWSHLWMVGQATIHGGGFISPYKAILKRLDNSYVGYKVFTKQLPDSFGFIFDILDVDKTFRKDFFKKLSHKYLSLWGMIVLGVQLKIRNRKMDIDNISKLILTKPKVVYLRFIFPVIPRFVVILPTKLMRWIKGKGFTVFDYENIDENYF